MRFSLEESMAELSELAGTAGLEVAGSTYQRVLEPNPRTYIGTGKVRWCRFFPLYTGNSVGPRLANLEKSAEVVGTCRVEHATLMNAARCSAED